MKVVVGAIFGIIQFVLGIVIFVAGVITGGIIVDSSYEVSRKEAKKKKQFSKIPSEMDEDRPKTWTDELAYKMYEDLKKQYSNE